MDRLIWWGETCNGKYSAVIVKNGMYSQNWAKTQKELKMLLEENNIEPKLPNNRRHDSIFG